MKVKKYKLKNSKEYSGFSKEIEAFKYNGDFSDTNIPDWFVEAIRSEAVSFYRTINNKDELFIRRSGVVIKDGYYIIRKLSGNIAACTEEMLYKYYNIAE